MARLTRCASRTPATSLPHSTTAGHRQQLLHMCGHMCVGGWVSLCPWQLWVSMPMPLVCSVSLCPKCVRCVYVSVCVPVVYL